MGHDLLGVEPQAHLLVLEHLPHAARREPHVDADLGLELPDQPHPERAENVEELVHAELAGVEARRVEVEEIDVLAEQEPQRGLRLILITGER